MGQFDGIGRIYRADINPQVDRNLHVEAAERDRRQRQQDAEAKKKKEEEKHDQTPLKDKVELHEEGHQPKPDTSTGPKNKHDEDGGLDISA